MGVFGCVTVFLSFLTGWKAVFKSKIIVPYCWPITVEEPQGLSLPFDLVELPSDIKIGERVVEGEKRKNLKRRGKKQKRSPQ